MDRFLCGEGAVSATLLVDPGRFEGEEVMVDGDAFRHLFRVRRLEVGERLRVVDGRGRARWGEVGRVERTRAWVRLGEGAPSNEPATRVDLLVPTLRPERAAWLVEKATEVGVAAVRFLHMERAPRTFGDGTLERLRRVAAGAVEQCGRARCPEISGVHGWEEIGTLAGGLPARVVLDVAQGSSLPAAAGEGIALLVGPEGGFSEDERRALMEGGWTAAGLGPRVLRAETAAVVGAAACRGISRGPGALA
jgi:16S rRNA (uracil1498-N3)-methyltransferase